MKAQHFDIRIESAGKKTPYKLLSRAYSNPTTAPSLLLHDFGLVVNLSKNFLLRFRLSVENKHFTQNFSAVNKLFKKLFKVFRDSVACCV